MPEFHIPEGTPEDLAEQLRKSRAIIERVQFAAVIGNVPSKEQIKRVYIEGRVNGTISVDRASAEFDAWLIQFSREALLLSFKELDLTIQRYYAEYGSRLDKEDWDETMQVVLGALS